MNPPASDIVTTRIFHHSVQIVFQAFSDPEKLARWWGPEGFTNTFSEFDFRPGGSWKFVMTGTDGSEYRNHVRFLEIMEPERIVFEHLEPVHHFRLEMSFSEEQGSTRLTWSMRFSDPVEGAKLREFIQTANEQNFDKLQAILSHQN